MRKLMWTVVGISALVIVVLLGIACGGAFSGEKALNVPPVPSESTSQGVGSKVGKAAGPVAVKIGNGTWKVGSDVKPGKYQTAGAKDSIVPLCYWDVRIGSEDGEFKDQGAVNEADAQGVVTLKKGQYFTSKGCKDWVLTK